MTTLSEYVALEVNGEELSLYDMLTLAKLEGKLQFVEAAIDAAIIRQAAAQRRIEVSDEELQQAADDFRTANELHDADSTEAWLAANHLSYEDWESLLEQQLIAHKLREALTGGRVEQYFAENRLSFDAASIYRLLLGNEEVARELRAQIVEDGADFYSLARQYSIDDSTRLAGGYVGLVRRAGLEAAVEAAVFGGQPTEIVGPFKDDDGWELIKVESLHPATLDDSLRETIKEQLFEEWLSERRRKARISLPVLEPAVTSDEEAELDAEDLHE
jgi:putative peptide maturation system protein